VRRGQRTAHGRRDRGGVTLRERATTEDRRKTLALDELANQVASSRRVDTRFEHPDDVRM
jgi:hypothetical protein